jgi:hypothetical protein
MKTCKTVFTNRPGTAALLAALLFSLAGCSDDAVSPCVNCTDNRFTEVLEQSFVVGAAAAVTVNNFTGAVTYRPGPDGSVHVKATKRAPIETDLDRINVTMATGAKGIEITTDNPDNLKNVAVDVAITAPADAHPDVSSAVGGIDYQGRPTGLCGFTTGVGSVILRLPADVSVTVDLTAATGSILVDFPVVGTIQSHAVQGKIGNGDEGTIVASTAVGHISLVRQ